MLPFIRSVFNVYPQVLAVVLGTLSVISDGMQYAWTAPTVPKLLSGNGPFAVQVTETDVEWLENAYMIGAIVALPLTIFLVDRIGRKRSLLASATATVIAWIVIACSTRIEYVFLARFLTGMSSDVNYVAGPTYIAEVADKKIRGFLSSIFLFMIQIGILLVYSVTPFVSLYVPCIIAILIGVIELAAFPFMPESPYYLLQKNEPEKARISLQKLRKGCSVEDEFQEIAKTVEKQKSESGHWRDIFCIKSNRKALIIAVLLNGSQHMCCKSVILMNLHTILEKAGTQHMSASTSAIIFAGIMLISAVVGSLTLDNFGRKKPLVISTFLSGLCLGVLAIYFTIKTLAVIDISEVSWVPSVTIMFYAAVFQAGLGLVPTVISAELFSANVKAKGMTLTDTSYVTFSFLSLQIYHWTRKAFGIEAPFYLFMFWCFGTVIFTLVYVPETKGQSLDEIQTILKGKVNSDESEETRPGTSFGTFKELSVCT